MYVQEKKPQHKSTKIRSKVLEFKANLIKQHKHEILAQSALQQEKPNDRKKLYEAIHLYMMKLALIKNKSTGKTPHQDITHP